MAVKRQLRVQEEEQPELLEELYPGSSPRLRGGHSLRQHQTARYWMYALHEQEGLSIGQLSFQAGRWRTSWMAVGR